MTSQIDMKFYHGLFLFSRQAELSIHQNTDAGRESLISYYKNKPSPRNVALQFERRVGQDLSQQNGEKVTRIRRRPTLFRLTKYLRTKISAQNASAIYNNILAFDDYLNGEEFSSQQVKQLQSDLGDVAKFLAMDILPYWRRDMDVEYYNQGSHLGLVCRSINEIVGEQWPG